MANTREQQMAIDTDGTNIIVSAGAGSGKTAVLTQRVIRKILAGIDVDRLLVLTFTNEAANEMKSRIRESIIKNKLDDQLGLLDSSYITTFDSFALSIVKKYSYILDINSNIDIVDSNIITIYKYKALDKIMEEMYGTEKFDKFISDFCLKDDKILKEELINLFLQFELLTSKKDFITNYHDNYMNQKYIDSIIKNYLSLIQNKICELRVLYNDFLSYASDELINKLDTAFKCLFSGKEYDDYHLIKDFSVRFTGISEDGKSKKDNLKKKIDEIKNLVRFDSIQQIQESIEKTYDYIYVIFDIESKLDSEVSSYKKQYGIYEFNDIAHMAIDIMKKSPMARKEVSEYFEEIMIDEYQDTSSIQEEFISLISHDNVYMVGDVKQSIYRFRNANPYIFQDKYDRYSKHDGGIKIDLLKNFRSRSETLNDINLIFNLIMDNEIGNANYLEEHNMVYGLTLYDEEKTGVNNNLEIYNYDSSINLEYSLCEKELFIVSEDINDKIMHKYQVFDKKTQKLRNIRYSDICIITDRNKDLETYRKILEYKGIPSVIYSDMELTEDKVILAIKNLISLVDHVKRGIFDNKFRYLFVSVARSFIFEYNDNTIYHLIIDNKIKDDLIIKKCYNIDISEPLVRVINDILEEFNIYDKLTNLYNIQDDLVRISNLIDIVDNLSSLGYTLADISEYFDLVKDKGLSVKYSINNVTQDAVKIMNIHKSKGLEFSLCYFTGMANKFTIRELNERILFNSKLGIILPYYEDGLHDTAIKDIYRNNFYQEEISEKIRLFYVALTRCREKMIIVAPLSKNSTGFSSLVPNMDRLNYRSFLDILNSISIIDKYVVNKEANYSKLYDSISIRELIKNNSEKIIMDKKNLQIKYNKVSKNHFSKESNMLLDIDTIKNMEHGTKIHEELEYADFNKKNKILDTLFEYISRDYINIYHEYEFIYTDNLIEYHGIIDLMLEYDNYINIVDYKLKRIEDKEYIKQLNGYKKYIESISSKKVYLYLYSIIDNKIKKI